MLTEFDRKNIAEYNSEYSLNYYRNYLAWLFATFKTSESAFRNTLVDKLDPLPGMRVLVTGVGFGDDIPLILEKLGTHGELHCQDISLSMIKYCASNYSDSRLFFTVSNATNLPYKSKYFDRVFHFGGINLFGDLFCSIKEMERVTKYGGKVVFGDEGVAEHLRNSEYFRIVTTNNSLYSARNPFHLLPENSTNCELTYLLQNCFYLITFTPEEVIPNIDMDVLHKSPRGGSMRKRFFGQLEGVSPEHKEKLINYAKKNKVSFSDLLEKIIDKLE